MNCGVDSHITTGESAVGWLAALVIGSPRWPLSSRGCPYFPEPSWLRNPALWGTPYHLLKGRPLVASFKKFTYVVSFYTRDEIDRTTPTQRVAQEYRVEASTATRAITAFKKLPLAKGAAIIAVVPDNENGRYDTGPSHVLEATHTDPELNLEQAE